MWSRHAMTPPTIICFGRPSYENATKTVKLYCYMRNITNWQMYVCISGPCFGELSAKMVEKLRFYPASGPFFRTFLQNKYALLLENKQITIRIRDRSLLGMSLMMPGCWIWWLYLPFIHFNVTSRWWSPWERTDLLLVSKLYLL